MTRKSMCSLLMRRGQAPGNGGGGGKKTKPNWPKKKKKKIVRGGPLLRMLCPGGMKDNGQKKTGKVNHGGEDE